jgi:hypothetical protein
MSASNEYTDWHLTPRGWEAGSARHDFGADRPKPPPHDRVLTIHYTEKMSSPFSPCLEAEDESWRGNNDAKIKQLLKQFGKCPAYIHTPDPNSAIH